MSARNDSWDVARVAKVRPDLADLPPYRAGARPRGDAGPAYSLASNESPFPPSPKVLAAISNAAQDAHRYPDPANSALAAALAEHCQVPVNTIALGTGAVALCGQVVTLTAAVGAEVVYAWRSFEAYPIVTGTAGAAAVPVPLLADGRHDLAAMAAAVTPSTALVFLCSPNNPTGPALTQAEVDDFLAVVPPDVLVVLDEAYREFVTDPAAVDGIATARRHGNVLALRTLSKAYGLAGLRVGYAVGAPDLIARLRLVGIPFGVSRLAEAAAVAALADPADTAMRVAHVVAERSRVLAELDAQGWRVPATQGNFVWLPLAELAADFAADCLAAGVSVRTFPGEGVRVSIGEAAANDVFLSTAAQWSRP